MPPSISIVIPAYNAELYLGATLDSVQAQTVQDWECIVVSDGSTDTTEAIAERYAAADPRIQVARQPNAGRAAAVNLGFTHSFPSSEFITFMDSDDVWLPDALESMRGELRKHPEAAAVSGLGDFIDRNGAPLETGTFADVGRKRYGVKGRKVTLLDPSEPSTFASLAWATSIWPPGLLLARRTAYELAGPFDSAMWPSDDWDITIRLSRHGDIIFLDRIVLLYRRHPANASSTQDKFESAWTLVRSKTFHSLENTSEQRRLLVGGWRAWQKWYAGEHLKCGIENLRHRKFRAALGFVARIPVAWFRWLRGYPSAKGLSLDPLPNGGPRQPTKAY
jgi:glycosyltransferase involved in cell wall biosynthesis